MVILIYLQWDPIYLKNVPIHLHYRVRPIIYILTIKRKTKEIGVMKRESTLKNR